MFTNLNWKDLLYQAVPGAFPDAEFRKWYGGWSNLLGINPNPDDIMQQYDYRRAFLNDATPNPLLDWHWPSQFKEDTHPNRFVYEGKGKLVDTKKSR